MRTLILTVGLPRSGKSTWAKDTGHPMVNPDSIRLAVHGEAYRQEAEVLVWAIAKYMVKSLFIAGHPTVVLDATNTTIKRQEDWNDVAESVEAEVRFKVFDATSALCEIRALNSNKGFLVPVIRRMAEVYEAPPFAKCL